MESASGSGQEVTKEAHTSSWLAPCLLSIVFLALTIPLAARLNIWNDEAFTLHTTSGSLKYALDQALFFEVQPPFYFVLLRLWRFLNSSIVFARLFSIFFCLSAGLISFRLSRRWFKDFHPAWFAMLLAFNPFTIWTALEIRVYGLTLLLSVLLLLFFEEGYLAESTSRRSRWAFLLSAIISIYTFYYLGFILLACAVVLLAVKRWRTLRDYLVGMVLVGAVFTPELVLLPRQMHEHLGTIQATISPWAGIRFVLWRIQDYIFPAQWDPSVVWRHWIVIIGLMLAVLLLGLLHRRRVEIHQVASWILFGVVSMCFLGVLQWTGDTLLEVRHTTPLFVPALLAVFSCLRLDVRKRGLLIWVALMAFFYPTSLWDTYRPMAKRGDWKRVAAFIQSRERSDEPIVTFTSTIELSLSHYYSGINRILPMPRENVFSSYNVANYALTSPDQFARVLDEVPGSDEFVWMVTDYGCGYLGVNYNCDLLEHFLDHYFTVETDRIFFLSRVRLLRRRAGTFTPDLSGEDVYSNWRTEGEIPSSMGYLDSSGRFAIAPQFDEVWPFSEGLAAVRTGNRFGFIDKNGSVAVPLKFDHAGAFQEGLAPVSLGGKAGFIGPTGKIAIALQFEDASSFSEGMAVVRASGKSGYIDVNGTWQISPRFEEAWSFSEGLALVREGARWGYIDHTGAWQIAPRFEDAGDFSEGLAPVKVRGKYGYIDPTGRFVIPAQFDFAHRFSEGWAAVRLNGKCGYIDPQGKWKVQPRYDGAENLSEGRGRVRIGGKTGFVDKTGKEIIITQFDDAKDYSNNLAPVVNEGSAGFADRNGNIVIPFQFIEVQGFSESLAGVRIHK